MIPLNQVISVTCCGCNDFSKKSNCEECFNKIIPLTTDDASSSPTSLQKPQHQQTVIRIVRIHYAIPIGKYQWKLSSIPLLVPECDDEDPEKQSRRTGSRSSLNKSGFTLNPSASVDQDRTAINNHVIGWILNVTSMLKGKSAFL